MEWCNADGSAGPGWGQLWGPMQRHRPKDGVSAPKACCRCGGGRRHGDDAESSVLPTDADGEEEEGESTNAQRGRLIFEIVAATYLDIVTRSGAIERFAQDFVIFMEEATGLDVSVQLVAPGGDDGSSTLVIWCLHVTCPALTDRYKVVITNFLGVLETSASPFQHLEFASYLKGASLWLNETGKTVLLWDTGGSSPDGSRSTASETQFPVNLEEFVLMLSVVSVAACAIFLVYKSFKCLYRQCRGGGRSSDSAGLRTYEASAARPRTDACSGPPRHIIGVPIGNAGQAPGSAAATRIIGVPVSNEHHVQIT